MQVQAVTEKFGVSPALVSMVTKVRGHHQCQWESQRPVPTALHYQPSVGDAMKRIGLSVKQPWADLVVTGMKAVENRRWAAPRHVVGERIVIHAGKLLRP